MATVQRLGWLGEPEITEVTSFSALRYPLPSSVWKAGFHPSKSMLPHSAFLQNPGSLFYQTHLPYSLSRESTFTPVARTPRWTPVHCCSTTTSSSSDHQGFAREFQSIPQVKLWPLRVLIGFIACNHSTGWTFHTVYHLLTAAHSPRYLPSPRDACKQWLRGLCGASEALEPRDLQLPGHLYSFLA